MMKAQENRQAVDRRKALAIGALFAASAAITLLGFAFCAVSAIHHVDFQVLGSEVPGAVFGVVIAFLGVRYFLSVRRLKAEVYKSEVHFSWSNFKRQR
jgi:hypothetical protein